LCLAKIKAQVENSRVVLVTPPGAAFSSAVQALKKQTPIVEPKSLVFSEYKASFPAGSDQSTGLIKRDKYRIGDSYRDLTVTISQERNVGQFYKLEVDEIIAHMGSQETYDIDQQFDVTQDCEVQLFNTAIITKKIKNQTLIMTNQTFSGAIPAHGSAISSITKALPKDGFVMLYIATDKPQDAMAYFSPNMGRPGYSISDSLETPFAPLVVHPAAQSLTNPLTGKTEAMKGLEITFSVEGLSIKAGILAAKDGSQVETNPDSSVDWMVTKKGWDLEQIIAFTHQSETPVEMAANVDTNADISEISVQTENNLLNYPNLSMYWQNLGWKVSNQGYNVSYVMLLKVHAPIIYAKVPTDPPLKGVSGHEFLGDSDHVQTTIPEVKALAAEVLSQVPTERNRLLIAKSISEVLRRHLTYNYAAIETGGQILEETTSEIIKNQNGTCHNFSNVFVAVARSLGIPARIVEGWNLDQDKATLHAWVEVEAKENIWVPMEPQLAADRMNTGNYFPLVADPNDTYDDSSVQAVMNVAVIPKILKTRYLQ